MWQHLRTLRFKLTLVYLLTFGVILTILGVVVLTIREDYLREDFDERLADRAESMVEAIEIAAENLPEQILSNKVSPRLNPFRFPGYFFQVRLEDGTIVERSRNLGDLSLPWTPSAQQSRAAGEPALETVSGKVAESLLGGDGELRVLTLYHEAPETEPFYLQVAVSLERVDESIAALRRLFLLFIPAGLLVAGLASWFMARRSLAPVGRIAREAQELTAEHLDRRIDLPPGGDEVAQMVATVNQMLDRLEASFRAQERFIANAAHELQTPVSILLGQAQVLSQQARSAEEHDRFAASVQDEMRRMAKTIEGLLTLARADVGMPPGSVTSVSLNEAVTDAVQRCEPLARQREVRLVPVLAVPAPDRPEPLVAGDGELLRTMIVNLLRNAIRYSPVEKPVEIKVAVEGDEACVTVRDHGPGIPAEHIEQIFEPFFRIPRGDGSAQGAGLGLAIAQGVAGLHQGQISLANCPDGGCEFVVRLPLTPVP